MAALPAHSHGFSAAERIVSSALRQAMLQHSMKSGHLDWIQLLSSSSGQLRRNYHDDMTCVVVFLPGYERAILRHPTLQGQKTLSELVGAATATPKDR